MLIKKSTYLFICLLLSIHFWDLSFLHNFLTNDFILILTYLWAFSAFFIFNGKLKSIFMMKYIKLMNLIFIGVFISTISANFFWGQNFITTFIAQRYIYSFILLPAILYAQPSNDDIIIGLKWISLLTVTIWAITTFYPQIVWLTEEKIESPQENNRGFGIQIEGIHFVIMYLYYKIQEYIKEFSWKHFMVALLLLGFIFLYQNRSLIIGAIIIFAYSLIKIRSRHKILIISSISIIVIAAILSTLNIWASLINQTQVELTDLDYNRWKALIYFINDYSPNWFCYIFGNGFPSANSSFGQFMMNNWGNGIYSSDLGMIGMWTDYGVIPLIAIYSVIFKVLKGKIFPLSLKFICFHILVVPTIFHFWSNPGIFLFVLIIYLYAYYTEHHKLST